MNDEGFAFAIGIVIGVVLMGCIVVALQWNDILITQEVADDVCQKLTQNETATADYTSEGKLICELPSFDATHNIIIRKNNE